MQVGLRRFLRGFSQVSIIHAYQCALIATCAAFVGAVVERGGGIDAPVAVAGLAITAGIAERGRVKLGSSTEASISLLPTVFAAAMFGPLAAMIVAAASLAGDFPLLLPRRRRACAVMDEPVFGE